jgi:thiamine pyrophosphate-dependent acetolactate synthase large subunit-like protein
MLMSQRQALDILAEHRGDRIVVTTMSSAGIWPQISDTPLDFAFIPSSMGQGPDLGLGLALAQPERGVIVVNGDGCTLMNLGSLVTLAAHPADIFVIILVNGIYEVTGGQATAGSGQVDFAGLARAAGIPRTYAFDSLQAWRDNAAKCLAGNGPVVIALQVEARYGQKTPKAPRPMNEQIARLQAALR